MVCAKAENLLLNTYKHIISRQIKEVVLFYFIIIIKMVNDSI